jgi:hypothetical protein
MVSPAVGMAGQVVRLPGQMVGFSGLGKGRLFFLFAG